MENADSGDPVNGVRQGNFAKYSCDSVRRSGNCVLKKWLVLHLPIRVNMYMSKNLATLLALGFGILEIGRAHV